MAKKKAGSVNKSAAVRDYLKAHPEAKGVEVVEALGKAGIEVSAAQVSNIKTMANKKNGKAKMKKVAKSITGTPGTVEAVMAAQNLLKMVGADDAKVMIDLLSK